MAINVTAINGMGAVNPDLTTSGMNTEDIMHISEDFLNQGGTIGTLDLRVSENSPVGMSVLVGSGKAYILNSSYTANSLTQTKFWRFVNNANVVVSITSNASGNPRITSIFARVDTAVAPDSDGSNVIVIEAVDGTPAGSPVAPATPNNAIRLANITVASGATSIVNANISNVQVFSQLEANYDGWNRLQGTFTRSSATVINAPSGFDPRRILSIGDKLEYTESVTGSVKYAYVVGLSATQITITSGSDFGGGIATSNNPTNIRYAKGNAVGFPDRFSFVPSWTNVTIGNATVLAKFNIVNRRCYFEIDMTVGSTTSFTATIASISFPVASASPVPIFGTVSMFNLTSSLFNGFLQQQNTTNAYVLVGGVAGTFLTAEGVTNTLPFTWATGWKLWISADYLIA